MRLNDQKLSCKNSKLVVSFELRPIRGATRDVRYGPKADNKGAAVTTGHFVAKAHKSLGIVFPLHWWLQMAPSSFSHATPDQQKEVIVSRIALRSGIASGPYCASKLSSRIKLAVICLI